MQTFLKEVYDGLLKAPVVTFALLAIGACFYMYTDLKEFTNEQKHVLTEQIQNQTKTVELLNQISQRLVEIERKIYELHVYPTDMKLPIEVKPLMSLEEIEKSKSAK